uniref:ORF6 n=1 Tax=Simian hemorrhagic fever virus TaxID=38143 RepID=L0CS22_SHFV|nr:ORF6 [Simian hemorrhagic fever virus]
MATLPALASTLQLYSRILILQQVFLLLSLQLLSSGVAGTTTTTLPVLTSSAISNANSSSHQPKCIVCFHHQNETITTLTASSEHDECLRQFNYSLHETVHLVATDQAAFLASHCLAFAASQYYHYRAYFRVVNHTVHYCWVNGTLPSIRSSHPGAIRWASVILLLVLGLKYRAPRK